MAADLIRQRLEKYIASDVPNVKGWFDAYCPLHEDDKRSAGFNFDKGLWSCRAHCGSGSLSDLIRRIEARAEGDFVPADDDNWQSGGEQFFGDDAEVIDIQTKKRQRRQNLPQPSQEQIEEWVNRLMNDHGLLTTFQQRRGISKDTLREFEVGWSDNDRAYTVPIKDADGELLNVRFYRVEEQATKIWSWSGDWTDTNAIYPERILKEHDKVVIVEGEWDALLTIQNGFPAVTGTTGAEQWQKKWNRKFKGKDVYICYDRDTAGDRGAEKVIRNLDGVAHSIHLIELPMEWREKNGLDVSDFFYTEGHEAIEFQELMRKAKLVVSASDGEQTEVSVKESFRSDLSGKPMAMTVSVVGKSTTQHLIPRVVSFECGMNADTKCVGCPMFDANGAMTVEIAYSDPVVLRMRDVPEKVRDEVLREHIGAHRCGKMTNYVQDRMSTEMLVVRSSIDHTDDEDDTGSRTVVNVGKYATKANRIARLIGTTYPSPKEQESTFQAWELEEVESSLDTYVLTSEDVKLMKLFQPAKRQTPLKKLGVIARDLQRNVTHIVGDERLDLHVAMDLVWHSVVSFEFGGQTIDRGWLELLVIGDTRTGKSLVAQKLSRHYGLGRVVSCETASIPGLLGAVKPMPGGKNWTLEWGAIPLNDRRLVVLDEVAGLTTDQIGQLSSVRSSGRAEIIKAATEITNARTRLIWLANARYNESGMNQFLHGCLAIKPLIGNQEDIARFDFAMTVSGGDVSLEEINQRVTSTGCTYTSEACNALLRWVWSRKPSDVHWTYEAEEEVFRESMKLGQEYVPDPPLIQGQNVRQKLARLAVAVAARTFSTDETYESIIVREEHVTSAVQFLRYLYERPRFGYAEVSRRVKEDEKMAISAMDEVREYLYIHPGLDRFLINTGGQFRRQQMEEQLNYEREAANLVIQRLASMSMIKAASEWDYRIQPHLNTILREIK